MEVSLLVVLGLLAVIGLGIIAAGIIVRRKHLKFVSESVVYRGTVISYVQDQISPFLASPLYEYELISGQKVQAADYISSGQQSYRIGQSLDIYVHKSDPHKVTARSTKLLLPAFLIMGVGLFISTLGIWGVCKVLCLETV